MVQRCLLTLLLSLFCIACSESVPQLPPLEANATILAIGDSLTYGTGTKRANSYPSVLAKITHHKVINAGVSGDTTAQALKRLPELLEKHYPSLVILSLGGNDLIRRVPEKTIQTNLEKMITLIQNTGASVILIAAPKPSLTLSVPDFYEEIARNIIFQ